MLSKGQRKKRKIKDRGFTRQLGYGTHYQMILEQFQLMNLSKTQTES